MRLYVVETTDGQWDIWRATPLREALHLVPKVKEGTITLDRSVYVVDPSRFRRIPYKPKRWLKLATDYHHVQLWKENDPEPQPLFSANGRGDDITGKVMAEVSRSQRLKRLLNPGTDPMAIVLLFSILANIVLALVLYSFTQQPVRP